MPDRHHLVAPVSVNHDRVGLRRERRGFEIRMRPSIRSSDYDLDKKSLGSTLVPSSLETWWTMSADDLKNSGTVTIVIARAGRSECVALEGR